MSKSVVQWLPRKSKSRGKKKAARQLMRIDASISAPANLNVIHVEQNGGAHNPKQYLYHQKKMPQRSK